jgi:hypothetical protein
VAFDSRINLARFSNFQTLFVLDREADGRCPATAIQSTQHNEARGTTTRHKAALDYELYTYVRTASA